MKDTVRKFRNFCFTMNNYPDTQLVDTIPCRYIGYSKEVGESGTPHLQGFICFHNATSLGSVISKMPGCHVMTMNGSIRQNEEYCSKESVLIERGDKPASNDDKGRANALRWHRTRQLAEEGRFSEIDDELYIKNLTNLERIFTKKQRPVDDLEDTCGIWIWGPTNVGKSHAVRTAHSIVEGELFIKQDESKWWDGYESQPVVLIEELMPDPRYTQSLQKKLLQWADKFSFPAEQKGKGATLIRPKLVIVTSNYSPDDFGFHEQSLGAIKRRFKVYKKTSREQQFDLSYHNVCV